MKLEPGETRIDESLVLVAQGLTKTFKTKHGCVTAIDDLNLWVRDGEFLCIVGPSGCGKTTFLRIAAGLEHQTSGDLYIRHKSAARPLTAMVFQGDSLLPWMTVEQNVAYGLKLRGADPQLIQDTVQHLLHMTGLWDFRKSYPHQLSGGMKQRANVARAFAVDPEILLMDEPFGLLDEQNRLMLQKELMQIWEGTGKTAVFITHSVDEALVLGDRVLVMTSRPGKVKSIVPVHLERPRDIVSLRSDKRFIDLYTEVSHLLSEEVRKAGASLESACSVRPAGQKTAGKR